MARSEYDDYPMTDIARSMNKQIARGATCFQKYTCAGCGSRQTFDVPNTLYTQGECEECGHITDIEKQGCNFMFVLQLGRNGGMSLN